MKLIKISLVGDNECMYLPQSGCSRHTNKSTPADGVTHPIDTNVFKIKKINYERKKNLFTY